MARKAQAANEIQPVEKTDNVPVSDAVPFQQPNTSNAVENKEDQSSSVTNQEIGTTPINEPIAPSVSDSKLEEVVKDSAQTGAISKMKHNAF